MLAIYGIELSKAEVAEFSAHAEQYVGVTSGGMDQAISMMGMPGLAKLVEFNPVGGGCGGSFCMSVCLRLSLSASLSVCM